MTSGCYDVQHRGCALRQGLSLRYEKRCGLNRCDDCPARSLIGKRGGPGDPPPVDWFNRYWATPGTHLGSIAPQEYCGWMFAILIP